MTVFATTSPNRSGIGTQEIWDLMAADFGKPWTVKELLTAIGLDPTEFNIKNVSNRCGYLVQQGHAQRIAQGTYALIEKGTNMTVIENSEGYLVAGLPVPTAPTDQDEFKCSTCGFQARSQMGLRTHITKNHKANKLPQDEVFERVAEATKILFPNPEDVFARFEEIGELRKAMFRALAR